MVMRATTGTVVEIDHPIRSSKGSISGT